MEKANKAAPSGSAEPTELPKEDGMTGKGYRSDERFSFCPHEELNLPRNYEEILDRFRRLQGDRDMEALN